MEMEDDESRPSLPVDLMSPEPPSNAYATPAELLDLDFGGVSAHSTDTSPGNPQAPLNPPITCPAAPTLAGR